MWRSEFASGTLLTGRGPRHALHAKPLASNLPETPRGDLGQQVKRRFFNWIPRD
jgi:hypothetical protein